MKKKQKRCVEKQAAMMEMMDQSVQKAIIEARTRRTAGVVEDRATQVRRGRKRRKGEEMRVALTLERIGRHQ
ncbi:unnamed protein product [Vitrella brassicaformis CCMP3155]|uniref:Uncharacterized protein n=1 Tax=Vitrella brassicaformis (strain CCMP3155) TaxID=1169540 RepID=A0A0G4EAC1_VITBC|nr:unnamed protein product [Vitrella brassicaformis CCMP3155]|eukprot:CEL92178.1 unnamed protein product [Vitrella brassicaformis CCMP3155]